jgi:hypothetical protein
MNKKNMAWFARGSSDETIRKETSEEKAESYISY